MPQLDTYLDHVDTLPAIRHSTKHLWQHQIDMLNWCLSRDKSLLYAEMGTGKTVFGLHYLSQFEGLKLVVCPKPVMPVWYEDYITFGYDKYTNLVTLSDGTTDDKQALLDSVQNSNTIVVVNYASAYLLNFSHIDITAMIADESHRYAKYNSKWSMKAAIEFADIPHKVGMTGTPFHDGYEKLYGQMRYLEALLPGRDISSMAHPQATLFGHYDNFLNTFCNVFKKGYVKIINGYKNLDLLADMLRPYVLIIKADDVHKNMPAVLTRKYTYNLPDDVQKAYSAIDTDGAILFDDNTGILVPHVLTRVGRLQELINNGLLTGDDNTTVEYNVSGRIQIAQDIVEGLNGLPVVIFTKFVRDVELLLTVFPGADVLTGSSDTHENWKQGNSQILIVNMSAGSEGVRLQRAHHAIFYAIDWPLTQFNQAVGRLRRPNQENEKVYLHFIVARDTIDETIYQRLNAKTKTKNELENKL